jgi:predicted glutamine amidotransferase
MCRLLGFVSTAPVTLTGLLGEQDLAEFTEMSREHGDGWGMAWAADGGVSVIKAPDAAVASNDFSHGARVHRGDLGMVHLRRATAGLEVSQENTHPFSDGRYAFAHNGSVRPPASLDSEIPDGMRGLRQGETDSERYFLAVLAKLERLGPAEALGRTATGISRDHNFTSLNCMLIAPDALYAVCLFDPVAEAAEDEPDYFHLRYRVSGRSVIVASTGWGSGWTTVGNGELITVRRSTLEVSVRSIAKDRIAS